jgi:hypothetical protein
MEAIDPVATFLFGAAMAVVAMVGFVLFIKE